MLTSRSKATRGLFWDGTRNFEPRSNVKEDTRAAPSPSFRTTLTRGRLAPPIFTERISIVKAYHSSNNSPIASQRKFEIKHKLKTTGTSVITIKNVIEKLDRTGSVDVSTLQRFLQNFALRLRHVIAIDDKHIEHVIN
ncbi:hypothetical protein AVEN_190864-1 [Araneus ventricosus]|uniref:Uncharacterized protein n=1 Tax=Araneus ventricosus TaxID=182803 RepID=A0A4Y2CQC6_ARAVE|nr:hypothetical protein AVEN_190864-1 [Araneus ventricosus]